MNTNSERSARPMLKPTIQFVPWVDDTIDLLGHDLLDRDTPKGQPPYVETFWLPHIGPTTLLLLRRAMIHLDVAGDAPMPSELLATSLGLGGGITRSSRIADTIARAERFGFAHLSFQGDSLRVRTHLPPLPSGRLARLPEPLQALHHQLFPDASSTTETHRPMARPRLLPNPDTTVPQRPSVQPRELIR